MSITLRSKKLKDGRKSLYLDSYQQGKRQFIFLDLYLTRDATANRAVMAIANKVRLQKELEQSSGRLGVSITNRQKVLVTDFTEQFIKNKEFSSQRLYRHLIYHVKNFAGGNIMVQSINPMWCDDFKGYLLGKVRSSSAANYFGKLKALLKYAVRQQLIERNPCDGITIQSGEPLPRYLTLDEIRKLLATRCGNEQIRNAFFFGIMSGLRIGDLKALRWEDIQDNMVLIKQHKTQRMVSIPLSKGALELLQEQKVTPISHWQRASKYDGHTVFMLPCTSVVQRTLKKWAKDAKIEKSISFHWTRHSFATLLLSQGVDPYVISSLMGHTKVGMTLRYAKLLNPRKAEVIAQFPSLLK